MRILALVLLVVLATGCAKHSVHAARANAAILIHESTKGGGHGDHPGPIVEQPETRSLEAPQPTTRTKQTYKYVCTSCGTVGKITVDSSEKPPRAARCWKCNNYTSVLAGEP